MNGVGIIFLWTASEATIKSEIIKKVGDGESGFIESERWREVVTGCHWVVKYDRIRTIISNYIDAI